VSSYRFFLRKIGSALKLGKKGLLSISQRSSRDSSRIGQIRNKAITVAIVTKEIGRYEGPGNEEK